MAIIVSWHDDDESVTMPEPPEKTILITVTDVVIDDVTDTVHIRYKRVSSDV